MAQATLAAVGSYSRNFLPLLFNLFGRLGCTTSVVTSTLATEPRGFSAAHLSPLPYLLLSFPAVALTPDRRGDVAGCVSAVVSATDEPVATSFFKTVMKKLAKVNKA